MRRTLCLTAAVVAATLITGLSSALVAAPASAVESVTESVAPATASAPTESELAELVRLSDPATLVDLHDGERRMARITEILTSHKDRRGIFAIFYRNILRDANPLLDAGKFDDPAWTRNVSFAFFHTYLENLHGHLTGGPVTPSWQKYYAMTTDPTRSAGRVAAAALDAHLLIDFPAVIAAAGTGIEHTRDFFAIGDSLINVTQRISDELKSTYDANLSDFFGLYFFGKAADLVIGQDRTSYVMFQSVRSTALSSGIAMRDPVACVPAELSMGALYQTAETVFDGLEFAHLI